MLHVVIKAVNGYLKVAKLAHNGQIERFTVGTRIRMKTMVNVEL